MGGRDERTAQVPNMCHAKRYFYDVVSGTVVHADAHGMEFTSDDEACLEAETLAQKLLEELGQPEGSTAVIVEVRDGLSSPLYRVRMEALRRPAAEHGSAR